MWCNKCIKKTGEKTVNSDAINLQIIELKWGMSPKMFPFIRNKVVNFFVDIHTINYYDIKFPTIGIFLSNHTITKLIINTAILIIGTDIIPGKIKVSMPNFQNRKTTSI